MSKEELKAKKPKYTETTTGTHCMGEGWTVCCPNKHLMYDRYIPTKQVVSLYYKGGIYRIFVCTTRCLSEVKNMAKNNPELFKKTFVKSVKQNGDLVIKHRDTGAIAQIAKKVDTYTENKTRKKGKTSVKIQTGGRSRCNTRRRTRRSRTTRRRR
jgi:phosphotransferase system IIB component